MAGNSPKRPAAQERVPEKDPSWWMDQDTELVKMRIYGIDDMGLLRHFQQLEVGEGGSRRRRVIAAINQRMKELEQFEEGLDYEMTQPFLECEECGAEAVIAKADLEGRYSLARFDRKWQRADVHVDGQLHEENRDPATSFMESDSTHICIRCQTGYQLSDDGVYEAAGETV